MIDPECSRDEYREQRQEQLSTRGRALRGLGPEDMRYRLKATVT